jgi:cytidine deaminase
MPQLMFHKGCEFKLSVEEFEAIPRLLGAAALANTAARQSNYPVQTSAMNVLGNIVHGGNREYAFSRAYVHGEEAVVSKILSEYPHVPLLGIGVYAENNTGELASPCPCGNCRDVLLQEATPNLLMVAGDFDKAVAMRLGMFMFDEYHRGKTKEIISNPLLMRAHLAAHKAYLRSADAYLPPDLKKKLYGVSLIDKNGNIFPGSFDTTAAYDAISPGVAAIQSFRNRPTGANDKLADLAGIVVVGTTEYPINTLYRDRNALCELDELLQVDNKKPSPTPVYLVSADENGNPTEVFKTDTQEWLPFRFTAVSKDRPRRAQAHLQKLQQYL